jgi:hypothetical protein
LDEMKNRRGLWLGIALVVGAIFLAARASDDNASRPAIAQVVASALHSTPTSLPTATPTPFRLTENEPTTEQLIRLLFQSPYRGAVVVANPQHASIVALPVFPKNPKDARIHMPLNYAVVITGEDAMASDGARVYPAAFGAVLLWRAGEYAVEFQHVEFGRGAAHVSVVVNNDVEPNERTVAFTFRNVDEDASEVEFRRVFILRCPLDGCEIMKAAAGFGYES